MDSEPTDANLDRVPSEISDAFADDADGVLQFMIAEKYEWTRDNYLDARQTLELPEELTPEENAVADAIEDFDERRCIYEAILDETVDMKEAICAAADWSELPPEVEERIQRIWDLAQKGCRIPDGLG